MTDNNTEKQSVTCIVTEEHSNVVSLVVVRREFKVDETHFFFRNNKKQKEQFILSDININ